MLHRRPIPPLPRAIGVLILLIACTMPRTIARAGGGGPDIAGIRVLVPTADPDVDMAQRYALAIVARNFNGETHAASAGYYGNPWIRDSFAWGMVPASTDPSIAAYSRAEIRFWLARQQRFGGWLTARKSGYFDETPILIAAVLDAYRTTGDSTLIRDALPKLERGWRWMAGSYVRRARGSAFLLYANVPPHIASDWVDQIARTGYATQLEALWYHATTSLASLEEVLGRHAISMRFAAFATGIRRDINRLLWTTRAPYAFGAPAVPAFGHYRSWRGPRDYFELDSNALCILYGIANRRQAASIHRFVLEHAGYLLGLDTHTGIPARVLYGDYLPADYASKRNRIGVGRYQSAYWPTVGSLVALALARIGDTDEARLLLVRMARAFESGGDIREWYGLDGVGQGAPHFQWAARMYIIAVARVFRSGAPPI